MLPFLQGRVGAHATKQMLYAVFYFVTAESEEVGQAVEEQC